MNQPLAIQAPNTGMIVAADTKAVVARAKAIQEIMKAVMKDGVHYGVIPGAGEKPTLYKQGSEVLLSSFQIAVEPEIHEARDHDGNITYTIRAVGKHIHSGNIVGIGVGSASTAEEKYAWRAAVCDEEFNEVSEDRKRQKYGKKSKQYTKEGELPYYIALQVRTNPRDLANTVLKMAKKRAQIDLCLTALSASDCFSQDLEDLSEEMLNQDGTQRSAAPKASKYQSKAKSGEAQAHANNTRAASEGQIKMVKGKLGVSGKTEAELLTHFKVAKVEDLTMGQVNDVLAFLKPAEAAATNG